MQLVDFFDFLSPDDIRIKGHRIGIESVLYEYLYRAQTPEEIGQRFPTLTLAQIYATILYYLTLPDQVSAYLKNWIEHGERMRAAQASNPTPVILRLRQVRAERLAAESKSEYQTR